MKKTNLLLSIIAFAALAACSKPSPEAATPAPAATPEVISAAQPATTASASTPANPATTAVVTPAAPEAQAPASAASAGN